MSEQDMGKEPWEKRQEERERLNDMLSEWDRQDEAAADAAAMESSGYPEDVVRKIYDEEEARDRWNELGREGDPRTREGIERRLAELDDADAAEDAAEAVPVGEPMSYEVPVLAAAEMEKMQGDMALGEMVNERQAAQEQAAMQERQRKLNVLAAVWQYDEDEGARALVDGDGKYGVYGSPFMRGDDSLDMYGQDCAEVAAPELAESPLELCERTIKEMPEERRNGYQEAYNALFSSGKDTKRDWYALYGRMMRDGVLEGVAEKKRVEEEQRREREMIDGFGDMVGDLVRGKKAVGDLSPEWLEMLQRGGVSLGDLEAAGQAYKVAGGEEAGRMSFYEAADVLRGNEKARQLMLAAVEEDGHRAEVARGEQSGWRKALGSVGSGLVSVAESLAEVQDMLEPRTEEERVNAEVALRKGQKMTHAEYLAYEREMDALRGAVKGAREGGKAKAKEARGFSWVDALDAATGFGGMMLEFANPVTKLGAVAKMYDDGLASLEDGARAYEMTDEEYEGVVARFVEEGKSLDDAMAAADKLREEAAREVAGWKVQAKAAGYAGIEYASMKAGLGAARGVAGRFVPSLYRGMTKATRGVAASRYGIGAFGLGVGATMFDLGVAMPAVSGAGKLAVDQIPGLDDAKISTGKEELAAWWDNVGKMRYWGEQLGAGALGGLIGARGRMLGARQHFGERSAAVRNGVSGEQYDRIMHLKPEERYIELAKLGEENRKNDFEKTTRRTVDAWTEYERENPAAVNHELAKQQRADEAVRATMWMAGMDMAPGEKEGTVDLYYGGSVDAKGKFTRGSKKMTLTEAEADIYVQSVMGRKIAEWEKLLKKSAANARLIDEFSKLNGEVDIEWMRQPEQMAESVAKGKRAQERIDARVQELKEQGVSESAARKKAAAEKHADIDGEWTLGEVVNHGKYADERVKIAESRGEKAKETRAYVLSWLGADGRTARRILRVANGASVREVQEELVEQVAQDFMEGQGITPIGAYRMLEGLRRDMLGSEDEVTRAAADGFVGLHETHPELYRRVMDERTDVEDVHALTLEEERALSSAVTEGVSKLAFSEQLEQALNNADMPGAWMRDLVLDDMVGYVGNLGAEMAAAKALQAAKAEGWMPEAAKKLLGVGKEAIERALAEEPTAEEYSRAWMEAQRRQAELDAAYGRGRVHDPAETDAFEERAKAGQQEADVRRAAGEQQERERGKALLDELAAEPENAGMSREEVVREGAKRVHDAREEELGLDPTAQEDAAFSGGACVEVTDERGLVCKSGVVEVAKLKLMPQFKLGADKESGVVHELKGDYFADHDPIRIFRNEKGELVVFSGRHRLDAAKRAGVERIMAYVYDGKTEEWARLYDIELNIRDNQATALEVAMYVRGEFTGGEALTEEQVASVGIAREGKLGAIGLRIGRNAGESVMDALRNGKIEDSEALAIADFAPGNENVQRKGLAILMEGGSKTEARERMVAELELAKMAKELGIEQGEDLFGNTLDNDAWLDFVAKYVVRRRNEITKDIQYLRTTATRKNAKAMAEKYGVDVKDPDGMKKALKEAESLRERWKSPYTDAALMEEMKGAYRAEYPEGGEGSQSERVMADYARYLGERESVTHFSTSGEPDWIMDENGNKVPIANVMQRIHEQNSETLKQVRNHPRYKETIDKIEQALAGKQDKAFAYRMLESDEVDFLKEQTGYDFSGYELAFIPRHLRIIQNRTNTRNKREMLLNETDIKILPYVVDNVLKGGNGTNAVLHDVNAANNRLLEVTISNPLTNVDVTFMLSQKKHIEKILNYKKIPKLNLTSAQVFISRGAGLAPAGTLKSAPPGGSTVSGDGGEVKQNLLKQEFSSRDTSILSGSRVPAVLGMVKKKFGWQEGSVNIDIGGGKYDTLTNALAEQGVTSYIYEPYGRNNNWNAYVLSQLQSKRLAGDTATCSNVLNVIKEADVRANVIKQVAKAIKPDGAAYFTIYEGDGKGRGKVSKADCWQNNRKAETYVDEVRQYFNDVEMVGKLIVAREPIRTDEVAEWRLGAEGGVTHFSVAGMRARTAGANMEASYVDPADGKRKFVIPVKGARLSTGFTPGQLNAPLGGHKDVSLAALLHYPALYQAYPWLADMRVRLYNPTEKQDRRQGTSSAGGFFCPPMDGEAAYIAINSRYVNGKSDLLLNVLLHESQHAIQSYEGHARGAGFNSKEDALEYIEKALEQMKQRDEHDDWTFHNIMYLRKLRKMVKEGDDEMIYWAYLHSRGEQEARYTGEQRDGEPLATDGSGVTMGGEESFATIAVSSEAKELGGVTYGGLSRFDYLLESRLAPGGEFNYDRTVYQMRDAIMRRAGELEVLGREQDGAKLVAEAMAVMESVEGLLPNEYRYGLEAYKVYLSSYAKLYESGDAGAAGSMISMDGWDKRMEGAYHNIAVRMLMGRMRADEMEFWAHRKDTLELIEGEQGNFQELVKVNAEKLRAQGFSGSERKVQREAVTQAWGEYLLGHGDFVRDVMKGIGEVRADKLVAKFLERAVLQLDAYRKDKTLGKIRRVVDRLTPLPGKDGKPVKGQLDAERYSKVVDFVRLMELTRGQRELFERERYTGDGSEKAWGELEPNDLITVPTYDADGKKLEITCTKQEFETYACFETMSAAQAEAAQRALGEFVTTGRQAWENAQEAQRARIEELCAPAMKLYGETENEEHRRKAEEQRRKTPLVRKMLNYLGFFMNDAQFLDAISQVPGLEKWTQDAVYRVGKAHVYIEQQEKVRGEFMYEAAKDACGKESMNDVRVWLDSINERKNSGVVLVPQEPDFAGQEHEAVRLQFMGLLRRKVKQKNFRPDTFAAALRYWADSPDLFGEYMPKGVLKEALEKYGTIGDADASRYQGIDALNALMTPRELERFADLNKTAKERAEAAREKWLAERAEEGKPELAAGEPLELTQAQAAYRVLMAEQADYAENLRLQGYTPEVLNRLREFAGERVMRLAYMLREKMGERTAEIKDVYERVYGMPFPEVDNYFRAYFNVGYDVQTQGALSGEGVGAAAGHGGGVKILYHRNHRNAKIEPTMDVLSAFAAGMKEQDVLLGYGDLPGELSRILNYRKDGRAMSDALSRAIGSAAFGELKAHVENMQRIQPEIERHALHFTRVANTMAGAAANMILNWRAGTLAKQYTAIFNALNGSDIVDMGEYMAALGRVSMGFGKIRLSELAKRPELDGRFKGWDYSARQESLLGREDVKTTPRGWLGKPVAWMRRGMSLMEYLDVRANVRSSAALYDAVYRKMKRENKDATHEELDAIAMGEVSRALALKSQPLDWRQRSLGGMKRTMFTIGNFFLGGESVNTFARCASLAARGGWRNWIKAAEVWLAHGAMLQALTALYNFITDDKEQWEKRSAGKYLLNCVLGPLSGIPFLAEGVNKFALEPWKKHSKWARENLPWVSSTELLPYGDFERVYREVKKAWKDGGSWQDKTLAVNDVIRTGCMAYAFANHAPTSKGGIVAKGSAYAVGGVSNILDFLLRTERAMEERWLK